MCESWLREIVPKCQRRWLCCCNICYTHKSSDLDPPSWKALCCHLYKRTCLVIDHGIHKPIRTGRAELDWLRRMGVLVSCEGWDMFKCQTGIWMASRAIWTEMVLCFFFGCFFFFAPSCNTIAGLYPIRSNSSIHYLATLKDWVRRRWDTERETLSERVESDCHCGLTCTHQSLDSVTVLNEAQIISQPGGPI